MSTSILDPAALIQPYSALSDGPGLKPLSIATGPIKPEKPVNETASARRNRSLMTAPDALARSLRCKTVAAASVTSRLRATSVRTANALASSKRPQSDGGHGTVPAESGPCATPIAAETLEAAVLFADMRGYTGLAEQLSPAQVVSILDEFFTMLTSTTVTYGGQVFHMAGDGMMAGFGIRDSRGPGARAALAAGHAMLRHFAPVESRWKVEFAIVTGIGIGLHVGKVALGLLGPPGKQAMTMIGDTANVAARLCSRARAGEILFSSAVADVLVANGEGPGGGPKPFLQLPQFKLRGRNELLNIWCVPAPERLAH